MDELPDEYDLSLDGSDTLTDADLVHLEIEGRDVAALLLAVFEHDDQPWAILQAVTTLKDEDPELWLVRCTLTDDDQVAEFLPTDPSDIPQTIHEAVASLFGLDDEPA